MNLDVSQLWTNLLNMASLYVPKVLLAVLTLIIGFWVVRIIDKVIQKSMTMRHVDESVSKFLRNLAGILLKVVVVISSVSMVGVEMTSFVAILGAAGLAVGLSLQGSLANFAGGVLIIMFRPYKVGDFIEAQGYLGTVHDIQVFNTVLKTPDNKTIIIPNASLSNGNITNYTMENRRRVDFTFGIGYGDDILKAKGVIQRLISNDSRIHKEPEPLVAVSELADSSVNLVVRVWCDTSEYWNIYFDMLEKVKLAFDEEGISIPFPSRMFIFTGSLKRRSIIISSCINS